MRSDVFVDAPQVDASSFCEDFLASGSQQDKRTSTVRFTGATLDESVGLEAIDETGSCTAAQADLVGEVAWPHGRIF
jgi:hypothetical protein